MNALNYLAILPLLILFVILAYAKKNIVDAKAQRKNDAKP